MPTPTMRISTIEAKTRLMSDSSRPVCSSWPRLVPSAGENVISSAAISERHANAQPCSQAGEDSPGMAAGSTT